MLAYGYDWEGETLHSLRENSLVCSRTELDTLIAFLQDVRTAAEEDAQDSEHWHLRDWMENWAPEQPDLILFLTENRRESLREETTA